MDTWFRLSTLGWLPLEMEYGAEDEDEALGIVEVQEKWGEASAVHVSNRYAQSRILSTAFSLAATMNRRRNLQ
jgi:hypothetical protein